MVEARALESDSVFSYVSEQQFPPIYNYCLFVGSALLSWARSRGGCSHLRRQLLLERTIRLWQRMIIKMQQLGFVQCLMLANIFMFALFMYL